MKHRRRQPDGRDTPDLDRRDGVGRSPRPRLNGAGGAANGGAANGVLRRKHDPDARRGPMRILAIGVAVVAAAAITMAVGHQGKSAGGVPITLPIRSDSYLGVYQPGAPLSYAGIDQFTQAIGRRPNLVTYYSGWPEAFQTGFANSAARHGAVPLVQLNPTGVSVAAIASGQYDAYLRRYAVAVRAYGRPVILSFGHEMNGQWYSWGYRHTSARVFVAAWRHIVTLFRAQDAWNATWLWTVNVVDTLPGGDRIPDPAPWWPGSTYVTWVGIDGYYWKSSWTFAPLFGPTIKAVRALTRDPILIAETGAGPVAGKPAKITDLFAGVRAYGLLGFVWFNANRVQDWRVNTPAAVAAFRRGASTLKKPMP